jgi:hypothetical protein
MTTITFRTDADVDRALEALTAGGRDRSQAVREAILIAWRLEESERLEAEARELADDADDRAEARAVRADMESMRAW